MVVPSCPYNPCQNGGTCYTLDYGTKQILNCACPTNYRGDRCEHMINGWEDLLLTDIRIISFCSFLGAICSYNSCQNGGACYRNGFGKDQETYCTCPGNYHGEQCEKVKKGEENN